MQLGDLGIGSPPVWSRRKVAGSVHFCRSYGGTTLPEDHAVIAIACFAS